MMGMKKARLSAVALGVALGVLCGVWMLIIGLLAWNGNTHATEMVTRWAGYFPGVEATMTGSFIAAAWGFLKGFFSGLILGWIYNLCLCCCSKCCPCCKCGCDKCACSKSSCVVPPSGHA